jgi:integrase
MTVHDACAGYLTHLDELILLKERKHGTKVFYAHPLARLESIIDRHHRISIELTSLKPADLADAPRTTAFRRAVRRLFTFNDLVPPKWLTVPRTGQRLRILMPKEYRRLRRAAVGQVPWIMALVRHCGLRPHEARELEWDRIHEERRVVELRTFKSKESRQDGLQVRYVPIPRHVARLIARVREGLRPHPEQLVFANRRGNSWTCQALGLAVRRAVKNAGLRVPKGEQITIYNLRHTFATSYLRGRKKNGKRRGGGDVINLGAIMGHADLNTTRGYCHQTPEDLVEAYDAALG